MPGPGPVVLASSIRIVHRLALVYLSGLVFDDRAVLDLEPAGTGHANSRHVGTLRLLGAFTRRLARAKTPTHVRNGHFRAINVLRKFETCEARTASPAAQPSGCGIREG